MHPGQLDTDPVRSVRQDGLYFQAVPFQCNISVTRDSVKPTAQARFDRGTKPTPCRMFPWPGCGVMTCFQVRPFQCTARSWPPGTVPTAQALSADDALTATSPPKRIFGVRAQVHRRPFQCSITILDPGFVPPTAHTFR